jgi:hypothetical protein
VLIRMLYLNSQSLLISWLARTFSWESRQTHIASGRLLPRPAKTVQVGHSALHHFLANTEWSLEELRAIRLRLTRDLLYSTLTRLDNEAVPKYTPFAECRHYPIPSLPIEY